MKPQTAAAIIDSAIRVLYNSTLTTFTEIFGADDGLYLWNKFSVVAQSNEGYFICYLDYPNQRKFAEYVIAYAAKNDRRFTHDPESKE